MTTELLFVLAIAGLYIYLVIREFGSKAQTNESQHHPAVRIILRLVPPLVALVLIIQLLGYWQFRLPISESTQEMLRIPGYILFWIGVGLVIWAREGLGIHWAHSADVQVIKNQELVTDGAYRYIRHPLHVALFCVFTGAQLIIGSWLILLFIPLALVLHWQSKKEELILLRAFGDAYRDYQRMAGMYIPRMW